MARGVVKVAAGSSMLVNPDDLAKVVDAAGKGSGWGVRCGRGIIKGGVHAAAQEEAVGAGVLVVPDDLAHIIDAERSGGYPQWIVEGAEGIDGHVVALPAAHGSGQRHHFAIPKWSDHPHRPEA